MRRAWVVVLGVGLGLLHLSHRAVGSGTVQVATPAVTAPTGDRPISFRKDIAPVLVTSCSTRSCHGGSRPPELAAGVDASTMRLALVGVASEQRPDRSYVKPGDPRASYLVDKIEGCLVDAQCADGDCGRRMPSRNAPLPEATQAMVRSWIAQGAADN